MKALDEQFDVRWKYKDIIVIKPKLRSGDPYDEMARIISAPWYKPPYEARTMVLDTITEISDTVLDMSADEQRYTTNPIQFGKGQNVVTIATEGDYRVSQKLSQELTNMMFDVPMDLCVVGHVGIEAKGKKGKPGYNILRAGLATVGSAQVGRYGGQFDQYIRLHYKSKQDQTHLVAQLSGDGVYNAKLREDGSDPAPKTVDLNSDRDPAKQLSGLRQFWVDIASKSGIDLKDPEGTGYFRSALYGEIGTGKTRLALAMPRTRILYIAADKFSEHLRSMLAPLKTPREVA